MGHLKVCGLVLRETVYKESDKILTVLARDAGTLTVKARGCRRQGSKIAAAAQQMVYSELILSEYREYYTLQEAEVLSQFWGIRQDVELLSLGGYFCEVAEAVCREGQPENGVLSLLLNSLYALDTLHKPQELVKAAFEWKLCSLIGYEPMVDACAVCGAPEPDKPCFNLTDGVLHCTCCRGGVGEGISLPLSAGAVAALRHIVYGNPKRLFSFRLEQQALAKLGEAGEAYLMTQLERGFHTLDFYKQLHWLPGYPKAGETL